MAAKKPVAAIAKHSLLIAGHQTSISVEGVFWAALKDEAARRSLSVAALVAEIDEGRGVANLSSAIRVHLFMAREGREDRKSDV